MRTEIEIADAQLRALDALASKENSSRSDLIGRAVDLLLATRATGTPPDAFGLWAGDERDGLAYQRRLRGEW